MKNLVFQTSGLSFKYSKDSAFDLSTDAFLVSRGESIAIVGPSGGGKSTLLRIIEGSLSLENAQVINKKAKAALIYQDLRLVLEKSALQNVMMGALGSSQKSEIEKNHFAESLLEKLGLKAFKDQPVSHLSGGQKQRVAIARALMSQPDILIADECFSHLDLETAQETYEIIKNFQREFGFAWIVTIHFNFLPERSFDRIWKVKNGVLITEHDKENNDKEKPEFQKKKQLTKTHLFFLVFVLLAGLSSSQLFAQLSSPISWNELGVFLKKLLLHSFSQLQRVHWSFLFSQLYLTFQMALLGTFFGFIISLPLALFSAEGIVPQWISQPLRFLTMVIRSVPALIWALFFVAGLGLGVVSGIAALTIYSVGYFSKLLYEGIEDLERKPFLAVKQLGASTFQAALKALLPSSKPLFVSTFIFLLEYNVRSASLLGLVGAGGIGQDLMYSIEWRDYPTVFAILVLLVGTVFIFDQISRVVRSEIKKYRGV